MVKNFLAATLLSVGTPMLLMGDQVRRAQRGNNNAYCQDNEISWFDWSLLEKHRDIHRFVKIFWPESRPDCSAKYAELNACGLQPLHCHL
jgi:pullulanase/glycogen debranching enzyme